MVKILHQLDEYNGQIAGEFWTLDGIGFLEGMRLKEKGFEWIKGPDGGSWQAPNKDALQSLIDAGCPIIKTGNGHSLR